MAYVNRLDSLVGERVYDDIIADVTPTAFMTTAKLAASETPLERGTILVAESADGQFKAASEALKATDVLLILAETRDKADADDEVAAYKSGHFFANRLKTDGEYELTAADLETLRKSGYLTKDIIEDVGSEAV